MIEESANKPQTGTWDNLNTEEIERKPKVEFNEINKPREVTFAEDFDRPREYPSQDGKGVFYVFDVIHDKKDKVILASAWSLLRGFKLQEPLAGKTLRITKVMKEGKQNYIVENVNEIKTEKVK